MRITGGVARGIVLKSVADDVLRPATGYLRQAVFSSLGGVIEGTFLDLFAGIGGYGLEALSRGAVDGIFIENNRKVLDALNLNLAAINKSLNRENTCQIWCADALKVDVGKFFDLIFIDPPYELVREKGKEVLAKFSSYLQEKKCSRLIFEMPIDVTLEVPRNLIEIRRLGTKGKNNPSAVIYGVA